MACGRGDWRGSAAPRTGGDRARRERAGGLAARASALLLNRRVACIKDDARAVRVRLSALNER